MPSNFPDIADDTPLGATADSNGHTRFTLYAPNKKSVHLIGDFNGWDRAADPMEPRDDGAWTIAKPLDHGSHAYRFIVDGDTEISDPYARVIQFPDDEPPRSVVDVGATDPRAGRSSGNAWQRPPFNDLILYEIPVNDFVTDQEDHKLRGLIDRLDHIQGLGVNAIQLMPIYGNASGTGWGYDPTHFFALRPSYGTADDFHQLIDECHRRAIAVILDIVPAHTGTDHPFTRLYDLGDSPYYSRKLTEEEQLFGLPSLDYSRQPARRFIADALRHWLTEFNVDGYRLDYLTLISTCGQEGVDHLVNTCRAVDDSLYLIGEHLPENPEVINRSDLSGAWHLRPSRAIKALLTGREVDEFKPEDLRGCLSTLVAEEEGYEHDTQMITYVESHDEERLVRELTEQGDSEDLARRKLALAWTVICLAPGEPMIRAGQEWGEHTELDNRKQHAPLHWNLLDTDGGRGLYDHHARIARLRLDHPAVRTGNMEILHTDADQRVAVFHRWNDEGDEVVVVANFSDEAREIDLPLPRPGGWRETQTDTRHDVADDRKLPWKLDPWTAAIFTRATDE